VVATAAQRRLAPLPVPRRTAWLGAGLLAASGVTMIVAGTQRFASPERLTGTDAGELVTDGVYRWSRNPQYAGYVLVLGGAALGARSGAALPLAAGAAGVFAYWVLVEEQALERRFGDRYREYRKRTSRSRSPAGGSRVGSTNSPHTSTLSQSQDWAT
jgi:protein-S-isoprenylcysteine O-methyltransferase Ste14